MKAGALSRNSVAIALAASLFSGSAGAGHLVCEDVTADVSMETASDSNKNKSPVDALFHAAAPEHTKFKSRAWEHDKHELKVSHPLTSSGGWGVGSVYVHDGKWAQPQFHGGQPNQNVPEPGALALLGIGLVGMALARRFKRT